MHVEVGRQSSTVRALQSIGVLPQRPPQCTGQAVASGPDFAWTLGRRSTNGGPLRGARPVPYDAARYRTSTIGIPGCQRMGGSRHVRASRPARACACGHMSRACPCRTRTMYVAGSTGRPWKSTGCPGRM